jgi:hypothetical protein
LFWVIFVFLVEEFIAEREIERNRDGIIENNNYNYLILLRNKLKFENNGACLSLL